MKRLNEGEKADFVKTQQTGKLQPRSFNDFVITSQAQLLVGIYQRADRMLMFHVYQSGNEVWLQMKLIWAHKSLIRWLLSQTPCICRVHPEQMTEEECCWASNFHFNSRMMEEWGRQRFRSNDSVCFSLFCGNFSGTAWSVWVFVCSDSSLLLPAEQRQENRGDCLGITCQFSSRGPPRAQDLCFSSID